MFGLDEATTKTLLLIVSILALSIFTVHYAVEGLKKTGKIDGKAGQISEVLSALIGLTLFLLRILGATDSEGAEIEQTAITLAQSIVLIYVTVVGSKLWHEVVKRTRGLLGGAQDPKVPQALG